MISINFHEQTIIEIFQGVYLGTTIKSFLIDRKASGLSPHTLKFYRQFLAPFLTYCDANTLKLVQDISPDFLRRYLLGFSETHNAGGVHALFPTLRAFFHWFADEEMMPESWKNPTLRLRPP